MLETLKKHPLLYGGIGVVVFVVVIYLASGSSATDTQTIAASGVDPSSVAAAAAVQQAQLAANTSMTNTQVALQANADNNGTQITLASISSDLSNKLATIQAQVANNQIDTTAHSTDLLNGLEAQVSEAQISANIQSKQIDEAGVANQINAFVGLQENVAATQAAEDYQHLVANVALSTKFGYGGNV